MITLLCEFNTRAPDDTLLAVSHNGAALDDAIASRPNLHSGDTILLRSCDNDFEVEAVIAREFTRWLGGGEQEAWVARAVWSTLRYLDKQDVGF